MDSRPPKSAIQMRRTARKKNEESTEKSAGEKGDQTAVAPTVTMAFAKAELAKAKSEMKMYQLKAQNLEKVEALTQERDFLWTQLSEGLKKREREYDQESVITIKEKSHNELDSASSDASLERKKKKKQKKCQNESDSESDSDSSSDSSDSSVERKKKLKKKAKKAKNKKSRKERKHFRQRVGEPSDVLRRYKKVLAIFQRGKTMSEAFQRFRVDRNTICQTAELAELAISAPEKYSAVIAQEGGEKILDIARSCKEAIAADQETFNLIKKMKEKRELLPIKKK